VQVRVENLYYLLSYACGHFEERDLVDIEADGVHSAEELFARVLLTATRRLLRQRLDRGYREEVDDLRRPRGKIHLGRSAARGAELRGVLECAFDETTEDIPHNRLIKATVKRLATVATVPRELRHGLHNVVREMPRVADIEVSARNFQRLQLHSNLRRYRLALNVCALLHRCLLPDERTGRWQFRSFAGNEREMGLLFEAFVREFLAREQRAFPRVERTRIRWVVEGDTNGLLPALNTDITLRRPGHTVIVETKCYGAPLVSGAFGNGLTLRSKDVCQLAAYLSNLSSQSEQVEGMLLYAVDRPTVPPTSMRLLGHRVRVLELHLNQPWRALDHALRDIVSMLVTGDGDAEGRQGAMHEVLRIPQLG
jgi:5-methylcytosine-specific restriction enzyme subunit McrC